MTSTMLFRSRDSTLSIADPVLARKSSLIGCFLQSRPSSSSFSSSSQRSEERHPKLKLHAREPQCPRKRQPFRERSQLRIILVPADATGFLHGPFKNWARPEAFMTVHRKGRARAHFQESTTMMPHNSYSSLTSTTLPATSAIATNSANTIANMTISNLMTFISTATI